MKSFTERLQAFLSLWVRLLTKLLLFLLAAILAGLLVARPAIAEAPQPNSEDYISSDLVIKDNAIQPTTPTLQPITIPSRQPSVSHPSLESHTGKQGAYSGRHYSKEGVIQLIKDYSARYGISSELPLAIAKCESGYNQFAKNRSSTASGVYQYLASTWAATDQGKAGFSVFDADANIKAAVSYIASRGHARPWAASQGCWST